MDQILFEIYKVYLFISFIGLLAQIVLFMYLLYKAATIKTDLSVTCSKQIRLSNILEINSFVMVIVLFLGFYLFRKLGIIQ